MRLLLDIDNLSKRFGGFAALDGVSAGIHEGERVGLIGPNGSGKSTLVNCLCGTLLTDSGTIRFRGHDLTGLPAHERTRLGMARTFQLPKPFGSMTVADNLMVPLVYAGRANNNDRDYGALAARAQELLEVVGLDHHAAHLPQDLTQVEMRKLELARAMASDPKLLIADEAMAGLSESEVTEIVALLIRLNEQGVTVILIEHIMTAVMSFSQRLLVLVSGQKIADGLPEEVIRNPQVESAYLGE